MVVSVNRLDRFYVAAATVELLGVSPVASVIGIATEYDRVSGHLPVRFSLSLPDSLPRRTGVIPRWVAEHEEYEGVLSRFLADIDSGDPYGKLCLFKDAAHAAWTTRGSWLIDQLGLSRSSCIGLACFTELLARMTVGVFGRLCELGLALGSGLILLLAVCGSMGSLGASLLCIALRIIEQEQAKLDGDPEVPDDARQDTSRKLRGRRRSWALSASVVQREEVVDECGRPFDSDESAADAIHDHWAKVFAHKELVTRRWGDLARYIQKVPHDLVAEWALSREGMGQLCRSRRHTSPGPDGVPYGCDAACEAVGCHLVHGAFVCMVGGRPPPASFLQSLMVFIPKGTSDADGRCVRRSPGNLRPLSRLDCDSKLVMSAIAEPLNLVAQRTADWR